MYQSILKINHWIMSCPCLIMFLTKCDQDKKFHVAWWISNVVILITLTPFLLHDHISVSLKQNLETCFACDKSCFWPNVTKTRGSRLLFRCLRVVFFVKQLHFCYIKKKSPIIEKWSKTAKSGLAILKCSNVTKIIITDVLDLSFMQ